MLNHTKRKLTTTGIMCLMLTATSATAYEAAPALQTAAASTRAAQDLVEGPTLGGLFRLYTPAEYEEAINQIKKYMGASHADVKAMKTELARLEADNGKGELAIYEGVFSVPTEATIISFNPTIVMRPELVKSAEGLTAEDHKKDIGDVAKLLSQAVKDKTATPE